MSTLTATDHPHLARAIELAGGGRGQTAPNPLVGAVVVKDGQVLGEGFHAVYGGPHAEREALAACGRRRHPRRDDVRLARAVLPPRADAAVHRRDHRGRHRPRRRRLRRPDREGRRPRPRHPARRGRRGRSSPRASSPPARGCSTRPFRKHARTGRPHVLFKSAMTLDGKVATRTGDSKWISGEASRAARAPLARRVRRGGGRHRHRAGRRPAAHRARSPASSASRAASSSTPRRACRSTPSSCAAPRDPAHRRRLARRRAHRHRRARGRRRRRDRRDRRRTSPRACARRSTSSARPASPRSCSRAARTWPARSSTPARSTRSACSSRPCVVGGSSARDPLEGEGVEQHRRGDPRADARRRARRRRRPDHRAAAGVVTCSPGWSQDLGTVAAVEATRRRRAAARAHRRWRASSPRATRSPSTASA